MSMHLEGPWLSTTRTKKRAERTTKSQREELERQWRERNVRLKQMGLAKETFEQFLEFVYGRGKKVAQQEKHQTKVATSYAQNNKTKAMPNSQPAITRYGSNENNQGQHGEKASEEDKMAPRSLGLWITGPCSSKPSPVYTGTKVKGIGTMHKSNAVPIFSDEEAIDISKMRR